MTGDSGRMSIGNTRIVPDAATDRREPIASQGGWRSVTGIGPPSDNGNTVVADHDYDLLAQQTAIAH